MASRSFRLILLVLITTLVGLASAQITPTLETLSPSFKEPAQDAFDAACRYSYSDICEPCELDASKALDIAKRKRATDGDRYVYDLLLARYKATGLARLAWADLDAVATRQRSAPLHSDEDHQYLALAKQCNLETYAIFDADITKKFDDKEKAAVAKHSCLSDMEKVSESISGTKK